MESENRMRGKGRVGENGRKEEGKRSTREIKIERWREKERDEGGGGGGGGGLKMMIHPDPSECCHVPPSR